MKRKSTNSDFGFLLAGCAILILGIVLCFSTVLDIYSEAVSNIRDQIKLTAEDVSSYASSKLTTVERLADLTEPYIGSETDPSSYKKAANYLKTYSDTQIFDRVSIISEDGTLYSAGETTLNIKKHPLFTRGMSGESFISRPTKSVSDQKEILIFSAPVKRDGRVIGIVACSLLVEKLEKDLTKDFYHGKGYCHIVNNAGDFILRSTNPESHPYKDNLFDLIRGEAVNIKEAEAQIDSMSSAFRGDSPGVEEFSLKEGRKLVGYRSLESYTDWNVICVIEVKNIWVNSLPTIIKILFITLISACIMIVFGLHRGRLRKRLEYIAYNDEITEGRNYNYFREKVPGLLNSHREESYFIIRLGVMRFQYINNNFGYKTGDLLLKKIYIRLNDLYPEASGQLAVRIHSDEFIVLSRHNTEAVTPAELLQILSGIIQELKIDFVLNFSIGVYPVQNPDEPVQDMVSKARLAQRDFRDNPLENSFYYQERLMNTVNQDARLEASMEQALINHEFVVYLQPKIDIHTEKPVGGEALVRWDSPDFGFLTPDKFIPLFERNGFIQKLDFYVLNTVCAYLKERQMQGRPPIFIAVNQSRHHAFNPNYIKQLTEIITSHSISPESIELEITESMLLANMEKVVENICKLREIGFQISIDDFGSGYTSLSFLQSVDVDVIKMDRSMLLGAEASRRQFLMLNYITQMVHSLGVKVVCEGVETENQLELVRSTKCDVIQGFYYAQPMPMDKFEEYVLSFGE